MYSGHFLQVLYPAWPELREQVGGVGSLMSARGSITERFKHRTVSRRETFGQHGEVRHENFNRLGHFARRRAFRHGRDSAVIIDEVCATGHVPTPDIPARRTQVLKACANTS